MIEFACCTPSAGRSSDLDGGHFDAIEDHLTFPLHQGYQMGVLESLHHTTSPYAYT